MRCVACFVVDWFLLSCILVQNRVVTKSYPPPKKLYHKMNRRTLAALSDDEKQEIRAKIERFKDALLRVIKSMPTPLLMVYR